MNELDVVIAGVSINVQGDEITSPLLHTFRKLLRGFLKKKSSEGVSAFLFYEHATTLRKFKGEPAVLSPGRDRETTRIINHVAKHYPVSEKTVLIGFLNGILAYNVHSRKALIFLFRSKGKNLLTGTIYKLLFILTSFFMVEDGKLLLHGAGLRINGRGNLFLGASGAGKSTVSGFVPKEDVLSDDATAVEKKGERFIIHASPFSQVSAADKKKPGHHLRKATLTRLLFLKKDRNVALVPRDRQTALAEMIARHVHYVELMDRELKTAAFNTCCDLCAAVPSFDLYFQKNDGFLALFQAMHASDNPTPGNHHVRSIASFTE